VIDSQPRRVPELNRLSKTGANFGFPYCHAKGITDPDVAKGMKDACKDGDAENATAPERLAKRITALMFNGLQHGVPPSRTRRNT